MFLNRAGGCGPEVLLEGDIGPHCGSAAPRKTALANALRFTACDTALRSSKRCSHVRGQRAKFTWRAVLDTLKEKNAAAKKTQTPAGAVKR